MIGVPAKFWFTSSSWKGLTNSGMMVANRSGSPPSGLKLFAVAVAIRAWVDALDLARLAEVGDVGLVELLPLGARVLALLARVASLARSLGADVPEVPVWLEALLVGAGGES